MIEFLTNLQTTFRTQDALDILIVGFIVYRLLTLIKGTRAVQMIFGLGVLTLGYVLSNQLGLFATHWLFANFFDYFVFIVIVIFQDDLRRALTRIGRNPFFVSTETEDQAEMVDEILHAAFQLAHDHLGALIVIERETGLKNFMDTGSRIGARVRAEILYSIFLHQSPIHDGAVIISGQQLAAAGCFLPLSKNTDIAPNLGTRHRAAVGLTEETDALVILVSEEMGQVNWVEGGKIIHGLAEDHLKKKLVQALRIDFQNHSWFERAVHWIGGLLR